MNAIRICDETLFMRVTQTLRVPSLDGAMSAISDGFYWWVVAFAVLFGALAKRNVRVAKLWFVCAAALALSDSSSHYGLKQYFKRERPCYHFESVRVIGPSCGGRYGFPSNHAANAMTVATIGFLSFWRSLSFLFFVPALIIGFSRVYLGVHYPGDVIAGYLWGALIGGLFLGCLRRAFPSLRPVPGRPAVPT